MCSSDLTTRGSLWLDKGDYKMAIDDFNEVLAVDRENIEALQIRSNCLQQTAKENPGDLDRAVADLEEILRIDPQNVVALISRGSVSMSKHDFTAAIADYDKAIASDPKDLRARVSRGIAWHEHGDDAQALSDLDSALKLVSQDGPANALAAWIRATGPRDDLRDGRRAVRHAQFACEASRWRDARTLGILAAAYAEAGDFNSAVKWQEKAIALNEKQYESEFAARLALYKAEKPFRDTTR